jgi:hypothetical protein
MRREATRRYNKSFRTKRGDILIPSWASFWCVKYPHERYMIGWFGQQVTRAYTSENQLLLTLFNYGLWLRPQASYIFKLFAVDA